MQAQSVFPRAEAWFNQQLANGLVDLKVSVSPGATREAVWSELVAAEDAIAQGRFRAPPSPSPQDDTPAVIKSILGSSRLDQ